MHPHSTEVMPEAWLHECAGRLVKWLAGRVQHFMNDWRDAAWRMIPGVSNRRTLQRQRVFVATRRTFAAGKCMLAAVTLAAQHYGTERRRDCRTSFHLTRSVSH